MKPGQVHGIAAVTLDSISASPWRPGGCYDDAVSTQSSQLSEGLISGWPSFVHEVQPLRATKTSHEFPQRHRRVGNRSILADLAPRATLCQRHLNAVLRFVQT